MLVRCNECMEVFDASEIVDNNENDIEFCPKCGKGDCLFAFKTKYKVGDKVVYLDIHNHEQKGTINEVTCTLITDWNKESKPLYWISSSQYLRAENEILGLYEAE